MVGLEGTELPTPHPVVEPVSDIRVRNGIFRCRDGPVRTAFSSAGDRYGDAGGLEKARVPRHKCADIRWSSIPEDWVVGATGIEPVTPSMSTRCSPAELRALRPGHHGWGPYIGSKAGRQGRRSRL